MKKIILFITIFSLGMLSHVFAADTAKKQDRTYQLLFDNLCDIEQTARIQNAPPTRSSRMVLPNRPPPDLEESPLQFVRHLEKSHDGESKFEKRRSEFAKLFWDNFEKNGNKKSDAQKILKDSSDVGVAQIQAKCTLTDSEKMHLLSEIKN